MKISSSRNIVKSWDAEAVQVFVPPIQTIELPKRETEEIIPEFTVSFAPEPVQNKEPKPEPEPEPEPQMPDPTAEILEVAMKDAEEIRQEAEAIRREAQEQAVLEKQKAMEEGFQEGYEQGVKEGIRQALREHEARLSQEWETFKQDIAKALASVEEAKKNSLDQYLDELKDCAVAVGEKVIHISLQSSGAVIKRMIMAEVEKLKKSSWIKIYMGRSDYDMLIEADADVVSELSKYSDHVKFVVMNKERRGDCIIEVPDEVIDISVDTQMENIRKVLENVR